MRIFDDEQRSLGTDRLLHGENPDHTEVLVGGSEAEVVPELAQDFLQERFRVPVRSVDNGNGVVVRQQGCELSNGGGFARQRRAMKQAQAVVIKTRFVEKPDCGFLRRVRDQHYWLPVGLKRLSP